MPSRILLVEGSDDLHVACALFERHSVEEVFEVEDANGLEELLETTAVRLRVASDLERLAVVVDADQDLSARWRQLSGLLGRAGCSGLPSVPDPNGTIVPLPDGRVFAAWIMPDNTSPGMLEDFVAGLIPDQDDMLPLVDGFLDGIPTMKRRFPKSRRPKARIHTWLAVQDEPGKPMGQAIRAYLRSPSPAVVTFLDWVRRALVA